jgi:hypothetical protein
MVKAGDRMGRERSEPGVGAPGVFVRVTLGAIPRDTSPDEGQVVKVDAETARELEADGRAVRLSASAGACHAG